MFHSIERIGRCGVVLGASAQKEKEREPMKRVMILATAALLSSGAFAQTATVELAPEQRTKIKQYVTTQKIAPVKMTDRVTVGATIPQNVELVTVPSDWGPTFTNYRYVYTDSNVVLVEPSSRKVVHIID